MSRIPMQALDHYSTGAHPVAAENRQEEVIALGTAVAGYSGKQILGSARGTARNIAGERTWQGQVFLVHLVCLVCGAKGEKRATSGGECIWSIWSVLLAGPENQSRNQGDQRDEPGVVVRMTATCDMKNAPENSTWRGRTLRIFSAREQTSSPFVLPSRM